MPMVRVRDLNMYYRNHGRPDGEPLVLLHNITSTGHIFDPFLDQLGEKYRLIVPDWRGHGRTTNPGGNITHSELAKDIAAFAIALDLDRAHYCGFSSGGMQLLFLAMENPQLLHSLTLVSANYTFDDHVKTRVRQIRNSDGPKWVDRLNALHEETHGPDYANTVLDLWVEAVHRPDELPFTPDELRDITCPTLILQGDRDEFFQLHVPVTMYQAIENATLCILPNCGHMVLSESPAIFLTALMDFLARNPF